VVMEFCKRQSGEVVLVNASSEIGHEVDALRLEITVTVNSVTRLWGQGPLYTGQARQVNVESRARRVPGDAWLRRGHEEPLLNQKRLGLDKLRARGGRSLGVDLGAVVGLLGRARREGQSGAGCRLWLEKM
jgi:hypothetical protein